jgi:uncharacterized membrane protein
MPLDAPPKFEHGHISPNLIVENAIMRVMNDATQPQQDWRLQGHIRNRSSSPLEEIKCDVSYFAPDGSFLGLDVTTFYELDKMDPGESAPIDIHVKMPIHTVRCVMNIHSKKKSHNLEGALNDYLDRLDAVSKERDSKAEGVE